MKTIKAQLLNKSEYAPYGSVIEITSENAVQQPWTQRFDRVAKFENLRSDATPNVTIFRCSKQQTPYHLKLLERHLFSTQIFIPKKPGRYLLLVAEKTKGEKDEKPDLSSLKAFVADETQSISYYPGTWHSPMISLDDMEFIMMVNENSSPDDCHLAPLPEDQQVKIEI